MSASSPLNRVPVPPGPAGPQRLWPALAAALDGGPAIAPVPTSSATVSNDYVTAILRAVHADDPTVPLELDDVAVVVATSGSTGDPRGVLLTAAQLTAMNAIVNHAGAGDGRPQWILAIPVTSMGGLNVMTRSIAAGRPPIAISSLAGAAPFTPRSFVEAVDQSTTADTRTSLVPAQVARLLSDLDGIAALRRCAQILVGGGALRPDIRRSAMDHGIELISTYGATESAGGCVFNGVPLAGVEVTADQASGRLAITAPCVASGYRLDPAATAEHFIGRTYLTQDVGSIDVDGRVTVHGRIDDVITINGVNVSPIAIERVVAELPTVESAAVVTIDTATGPELHTFVVTQGSTGPGLDEVRATVAERLGPAARPHQVHGVPELPHLPNGKVDRRFLQQQARSAKEQA